MPVARRDLGSIGDTLHFDGRGRTAADGPVAQLPFFVVPPALDVATRQQRARIASASRDLHGIADAAHFYGLNLAFSAGIPELPVFVVSPAVDLAGRSHCARIFKANGDLGRVEDGLHADRCAEAATVGAVAELVILVPPPAGGVRFRQQRARVFPARGHLGGAGEAQHFDWRVRAFDGAVPELAVEVAPPAVDVASRQQRT